MEIRTVYVAFPGTDYETAFEIEEACKEYEEITTPKMWDSEGNPTLNGETAMFVQIKEGMAELVFDLYGKQNFPGIDEEDEGVFYWDDYDEVFRYLDTDVIRRAQRFVDSHPEVMSDF